MKRTALSPALLFVLVAAVALSCKSDVLAPPGTDTPLGLFAVIAIPSSSDVTLFQSVAFLSFVASKTILGTSKDLDASQVTEGSMPTTWVIRLKISRSESPVPVPTLKMPDIGFTVAR